MFSETFIRRPRFAIVISLFLLLTGALCAFKLPVAEYPPISPPTIMVIANYPGASAQVIADTVAAPLESYINSVEDLAYYSSTSDNSGGYMLIITFKPDADADMALVNVNNAVKRAERMLPGEVVDNGLIVVKRSPDIIAIITFTSENPNHDGVLISNYVDINVKDAISRINGIGQVVMFGEMKYSMRVWLDPNRMRALDIGYAEVAQAIQQQNVQAATGSIGTELSSNAMQFKVDAKGRLTTAEEFENIVVRSGEDGRQVKLGDISRIELGSERYKGFARYEGSDAVMLAIFKLNDANALTMYDDVIKEIKSLEDKFPEGLTWDVTYDSTAFVRMAMVEIRDTLLLTFILVVLITYIFLQDWRATLVPMVTIPVSLIGTFVFLQMFGMSINTLSMFALILVIGSVVDDAICVVESCVRLIQEEKLSPFDAAMKTMEQLSGALVATTLVVVAVYLPIGFYGGMVGAIYKEFAIAMCVALCLSTVNALTLSPALCALLLRDTGEPRGLFKQFNKLVDFTRSGYLGIGGFLARRLVITGILFLAILAANVFVYEKTPTAFVPNEDKGAIFCELILPSGAPLSQTDDAIKEALELLHTIPGIRKIATVSGRTITAGEGENMALLVCDLEDWADRKSAELQITNIQRQIASKLATIPDASSAAFTPPPIVGLGATGGVTFSLMATGTQTPMELSQSVTHLLSKIMESGKALYCFTSFDANTPMVDLKLDRSKAEAMNIPVSAVFNTLQTQLGSIYVNDINLYSRTYKVKVQSEAEFRENINSIGQLHVTSNNGASVPLNAISTLDWVLGPRQAERFNMFQSAWVNVQSRPFVSSGEMMDLIQELVSTELSKDFQIGWTDMSYQEQQNQGQIVWLLVLSLVMAYLFLVAQYESWTMPISVILSVATATLGGLIALRLYGRSLDIYCQLGLMMLVGLTAKTAILMVEFAKQERDEGASIYDAAMEGMRMRFRSVVMTGLSFVIGVFPMVIASGAGSASRQSIGKTTFWGMVVAMLVGMVFIPGLYVIFQIIGEAVLKTSKSAMGRRKSYSRRIILKKK